MALEHPLKLDFLETEPLEPIESRQDKKILELQVQLSQLQSRNQQLEQENARLHATQKKLVKEFGQLEDLLQKLEKLKVSNGG